MKHLLLTAAALAATITTSPAHAWGQLGHRVIGELAAERISGRTRAEIAQIAGDKDLAEISTVPDEERSNPDPFWAEQSPPWHYITIPDGQTYEQAGPPAEGDGLTALARFTAVLRDPAATREQKQTALALVIHIVEDLHQPLHVGGGDDRGGNDVRVSWFGSSTNLHSVWDTRMLEGVGLGYTEYAVRLSRAITPAETLAWWTPDPLVWTAESAAIRATIYPAAAEGGVPRLSYEYSYQHLPTAEQRLRQGSVRLAAYLDWIFATPE